MREEIYALRDILKAQGLIYSPEDRPGENKYTMTIISTPADNRTRGTIAGAQLKVKREIIVTVYYEKTNNPDKEILILEKQDSIIGEFYKYGCGKTEFERAEIVKVNESFLNELRFIYQDSISL